jgi:hypothetical protein
VEIRERIAELALKAIDKSLDNDSQFAGTFGGAITHLAVFSSEDPSIADTLKGLTFATPYTSWDRLKIVVLMHVHFFDASDRIKHQFASGPPGFRTLPAQVQSDPVYDRAIYVARKVYKATMSTVTLEIASTLNDTVTDTVTTSKDPADVTEPTEEAPSKTADSVLIAVQDTDLDDDLD